MAKSDFDKLKIAVVQMRSVDSYELNVQYVLSAVELAVAGFAKIVFFPENCLYLRLVEGEQIPGISLDDVRFSAIQEVVNRAGVIVHLGSVPLLEENPDTADDGPLANYGNEKDQTKVSGRLTNASVVICPNEKPKVVYRKIHLFDVDVDGGGRVRESDVFRGGSELTILDVCGWKFASAICYDLRFAELFAVYARLSVDVILIPSSFLVPTGRAHWHILARARAIESQAYVIAAAQGGVHTSVKDASRQRRTFGHSLVVEPWGEVVLDGPDSEDSGLGHFEVLIHELDRARIEKARRQIPMSLHRKVDLENFKVNVLKLSN